MATRQPIRGGSEKLYDVIGNFSQGINRNITDDLASDSSFKELKNFYNANEGALSKRPGVVNTNLAVFIDKIANQEFDPTKFRVKTNRFGDTPETLLAKIQDFNNTILKGIKKIGEEYDDTTFTFTADKVIGFQLLKNNFFLDALQNYEELLSGEYSSVNSNILEFSCIAIIGGFYTTIIEDVESSPKNGLYIARFNVKLEHDSDGYYDVYVELDTVDSTLNPQKDANDVYQCRWCYLPDNYKDGDDNPMPSKTIDISNFNGESYIATGTNYIIKVQQDPEQRNASKYIKGETEYTYDGESTIITQIGGYNQDNLYRPTPIELTQIGFNILALDPLKYYKLSGNIAKVKGIYYGVNVTKNGRTFEQPIGTTVPYNEEFFIHILYTGSTAPGTPEYRVDNGETDESLNPYEEMPGEWVTGEEIEENSIFKCSGINSNQAFEIRIKTGDDVFIGKFETTSNILEETGYIEDVSKLVFSSTHSMVMNNQLVLYGGHGYLFFSEYDDFSYFPNYYYIYVANEAGEEEVTKISYFRQYYAVFTNKRIKRMSGAFGTDDFGIYPLSDFIGCSNGRTVKALGNNLLFLGNDGIYKLKQGYLGEGTENVEKIDSALGNDLNLNNVLQSFVLNNNYIIVKNDGRTWVVYNTQTEAFYEYDIESLTNRVYNGDSLDEKMARETLCFYSLFQANLFDEHGDFLIVPMYNYTYNEDYTKSYKNGMEIMIFRFNELLYLEDSKRHKDGEGFISILETHAMNMGYPTHTKKFKQLFIKLKNESGYAIPLYITITVDDNVVLSPKDYVIKYDEETDTYYYVEVAEANNIIDISRVLGELVLGKDPLGDKTIQQLKIKIGAKGKSIKIRISDGYNDSTSLIVTEDDRRGLPIRDRNIYDFSLLAIGIVFKLKKVKEG